MQENNDLTDESMQREVDEMLLPAFLLGLVEISGPIDDQDRYRARRMLEVSETRAKLAQFFRERKIHSGLRILLQSHSRRTEIDEQAKKEIASQLGSLKFSSNPEDISDAVWEYVSTVRKRYAESILAGVLPK